MTPLAVEVLTVKSGKTGMTGSFLDGRWVGSVAQQLRDILKIAEMCCDTVCATPCSATGFMAMV